VVVKNGLVLAVEAVGGTDAAIRRGGELARGGAVVVRSASRSRTCASTCRRSVGDDPPHGRGRRDGAGDRAGKTIVLGARRCSTRGATAGIAVVAVEVAHDASRCRRRRSRRGKPVELREQTAPRGRRRRRLPRQLPRREVRAGGGLQLVAVADVDRGRAEALAARLGTRAVADFRELLGAI
jgi:hypothetical protein